MRPALIPSVRCGIGGYRPPPSRRPPSRRHLLPLHGCAGRSTDALEDGLKGAGSNLQPHAHPRLDPAPTVPSHPPTLARALARPGPRTTTRQPRPRTASAFRHCTTVSPTTTVCPPSTSTRLCSGFRRSHGRICSATIATTRRRAPPSSPPPYVPHSSRSSCQRQRLAMLTARPALRTSSSTEATGAQCGCRRRCTRGRGVADGPRRSTPP